LNQIIAISGKKIDQEKAALVLPKNNNREILELLDCLSKKDSTKALRLVNGLLDGGVNIKNFISEAVELIRKLLLNKVSPGLAENVGLDFGESLELKINELQEKLSLENIVRLAQRFNSLAGEQKNALIIQLPLELAIIELCLSPETTTATKINTNVPKPESLPSKKEEESLQPAKKNELKNVAPIANGDLEKKWVEFLIKIKHLNHSLSFVMQNSKPEGVNNGILTLGFKYKLHSDRVGQIEIKDLIEKTLQEVYGTPIKIQTRLDDSLVITPRDTSGAAKESEEKKEEIKKVEGNSFINNFLQSFGGEIIS